MISHGAVENALQEALNVGPEALSVVAVPDERKGEKLCVIHTDLQKTSDEIIDLLKTLDIPNLWKPNSRDWIQVESLPLLGTGKLDFRAMKELAQR